MKIDNAITAEKNTVQIGIAPHDRRAVADALSLLLADEHVLYIKLRNYHWNVTGMHFKPLHELFEEQYNMLHAAIDEIAERIRTLGFFAPGSMQQFQQLTRLKETGHLDGDARSMLENLLLDHEALTQIIRHDIDVALDEHHDVGTSDFLTGLLESHEKMAWMIRAYLG